MLEYLIFWINENLKPCIKNNSKIIEQFLGIKLMANISGESIKMAHKMVNS